ncbi:hypothetical protein PILCRDRAFT_605285 [Piloderma croceum F 1598]|uniref:Uncharacterized protein n=1 Tax=Piloderma croceum (strain F 1598) TaxID=765440 RepID=A0A0C3FDN3_PILCF|nr:hypothetical protein PILCRDRAFT_605285 [Piloderma croceum F 1598]
MVSLQFSCRIARLNPWPSPKSKSQHIVTNRHTNEPVGQIHLSEPGRVQTKCESHTVSDHACRWPFVMIYFRISHWTLYDSSILPRDSVVSRSA